MSPRSHSRAELGSGWSLAAAVGATLQLGALGEFPGVSVASSGMAWHRLEHSRRSLLAANAPYTLSVWVKRGTSATLRVTLRNNAQRIESNVDLSFDSDSQTSSHDWGAIANASLTELEANGLHLARLTFTPTLDGELNFGVGPGTSTPGETVVVLGAQMEPGLAASTYIRTDGAPNQRDADIVTWDAPTGVWDLRVVDGQGQAEDTRGVTVGAGWAPQSLPFAPARVLLYPAGTL